VTHVALAKSNGFSEAAIREAVFRAMDLLNYDLDANVDSVVIKPNLCYYWDYSTGETTDPRVVSAVIDWIRNSLGNATSICIAEADASAMRTKYVFKMLGYEKLSVEKKVTLVNLSEGDILEKEAVVAGTRWVLPVNKILLEKNLLINVPKLKYHRAVGFTCALKNIFGAISKPYKFSYHKKLAQVIVAINKIVRTDIVLVDGIVVAGKTPKKLGVAIAGNDAVACDFVAAKASGREPSRIGYLKLAVNEKIGNPSSLTLIENPTRLSDIRKEFPKQSYLLQKWLWGLQLKGLRTYARFAGDIIPPVLWENNMQ
jgi:uncharacterized protein (DUF362 family)